MKNLLFPCILLLTIVAFPVASQGQMVNRRHVQQTWQTDTANHVVPLHEFRILLKRDAIRPIDTPRFVPVKKAAGTYFGNEPVCVVFSGEKAKAYPLSVLLFHEIVNDEFDHVPVSVTYCPLCNSLRVFNRNIQTEDGNIVLDFGTTGMLRKSNLVMWDRQSETWWQQFTGIGVVGKYTGMELHVIPSMILSFKDYKTCFPKGDILFVEKKPEGPPYGMNPYRKYDSIYRKPRLFFEKIDKRLPPMERVVHVSANDMDRIYPYPLLKKYSIVNDDPGGKNIVIFYREGMQSILDEKDIRKGRDIGNAVVFVPVVDGRKLSFIYENRHFKDNETGSEWCISGKCVAGKLKGKQLAVFPYTIDFAFALFAFYPDVEIYSK